VGVIIVTDLYRLARGAGGQATFGCLMVSSGAAAAAVTGAGAGRRSSASFHHQLYFCSR